MAVKQLEEQAQEIAHAALAHSSVTGWRAALRRGKAKVKEGNLQSYRELSPRDEETLLLGFAALERALEKIVALATKRKVQANVPEGCKWRVEVRVSLVGGFEWQGDFVSEKAGIWLDGGFYPLEEPDGAVALVHAFTRNMLTEASDGDGAE